MEAQQIINETETKEDNLKFFYPEMDKQKEADLNLTRCLKELKGGLKE